MIRSFRHKGLHLLFERNDARKVAADQVDRIRERLTVLHQAAALSELNVPGYDFHALRGKPRRYTIHINGPWCLTFEWEDGDALRVDLEQYH
jgi:toxin HigB-1